MTGVLTDLGIALGRVGFVMLFVLNMGGLLTWVERDGTFTNFEGRVQRFWKAVEPLGASLADWEIIGRVGEALGLGAPPARAEDCFKALAASVPAFGGLSYRDLKDTGKMVAA